MVKLMCLIAYETVVQEGRFQLDRLGQVINLLVL